MKNLKSFFTVSGAGWLILNVLTPKGTYKMVPACKLTQEQITEARKALDESTRD